MNNINSTTVFALLLLTLFGCSSGTVPGEDDDGGGSGGGATSCGGCPCVGDLTVSKPQSVGNSNICAIGGTLTQNATLPALTTDKWHIVDSIVVDSGILTVQPGVEVLAEAGEYIYVMPGASIRSVGTTSNPIVFSSVDNDFDLDASSGSTDGWVGIVIEEGLTSAANRLEYTVIAEAGEPGIVGGKSVDAGLTLAGSHNNTVIRNTQIHASYIDGITLDGAGTVNAARLEQVLITGSGRDGIHYQQFSGLIKDFLVIHRPGTFTNILNGGGRSEGGRAGIRGGGDNSLPFIMNGTLIGNDTSTNAGSSSELEVAFIFDSNLGAVSESTRMANIVTNNFRNGCYSVANGVDLSGVDLLNAPDASFVDGVHCVNDAEINSLANILVDLGGQELDTAISGAWSAGADDGLRFYEGTSVGANFYGTTNNADLTAAWFLESVDANPTTTLTNGGANSLNLFNDGVVDIIDNSSDPLLAGIVQLGGVQFFCGDIPADFPPGVTEFIDPNTELRIEGQPTSGTICGFIKASSVTGGFNIGTIGAVNTSASDVFDGWALHQCLAPVTDPDFCP